MEERNFVLIAIVAIVAIVGMVVLILGSKAKTGQISPFVDLPKENIGGEAIGPRIEAHESGNEDCTRADGSIGQRRCSVTYWTDGEKTTVCGACL